MLRSDTAAGVTPFLERALDNRYAQENLSDAAEKLRAAYRRASKRRVEPTRDKRLHEQLRQAALSITTPLSRGVSRCEVYAGGEVREFDGYRDSDDAASRAAVLDELVAAVRESRPARIDAERGLLVQRLLDRAYTSLQQEP